MGMMKEFKEFAMRGNVVDLAVGVIIGAAFGNIVNSAVKDIIMPPIGLLTGGMDFADKKFVLQKAVIDATNKVITPENAIKYGNFINVTINFIIVAFCIFMIIKAMNALKKKEDAAPPAPHAPTVEETLLTEIRDLLKK